MNGKIAPIVIIDVETTGLDADLHRAWDVAVIRRFPSGPIGDLEYQAFVAYPDLCFETAHERALNVGRFSQRYRPDEAKREWQIVNEIIPTLSGAIIVGANPWFDEAFLWAMFRRCGIGRKPWDYHLLNVTDYAAGAIGAEPPYGLDDVLGAYGVNYAALPDRHTALGDARIERDLYDAARRLRVPGMATRNAS